MRRPFHRRQLEDEHDGGRGGSPCPSAVAAKRRTGAACDVAVCPPFPHLAAVREAVRGSAVAVGAQNAYWEPAGAFTGEVSLGSARALLPLRNQWATASAVPSSATPMSG